MSRWWMATAVLLVAGCSHAARETRAAAPMPVAEVAPPATPVVQPVQPASCSTDTACAADELCISARCVKAGPNLAACRPTAHFDFDQAELHDQDLPRLQRAARCLAGDPAMQLRAEGDCDDRGTEEYNLHLGQQRADAVASYLRQLGVPRPQLSTVSFGKENPVCTQETPSCWRQNRRTDLKPPVGASPAPQASSCVGGAACAQAPAQSS